MIVISSVLFLGFRLCDFPLPCIISTCIVFFLACISPFLFPFFPIDFVFVNIIARTLFYNYFSLLHFRLCCMRVRFSVCVCVWVWVCVRECACMYTFLVYLYFHYLKLSLTPKLKSKVQQICIFLSYFLRWICCFLIFHFKSTNRLFSIPFMFLKIISFPFIFFFRQAYIFTSHFFRKTRNNFFFLTSSCRPTISPFRFALFKTF